LQVGMINFRKSMQLVRDVLALQPFLGGQSPYYADFVLASNLLVV